MDTYAGDGGLHSIHDSETGETTTYVRDSLGRLISARSNGEKATQYSYDENNRLTRWVYTIPTLSRTAMHYTYNTDTTDTVPDGVLTGVTMFDGGSIAYSYDFLQRLSNRTIAGKLKETYAYAPGSGENTTTNRVSTKRVFWNNARIHQFQHGYDALGNITNIYDAVTLKRVNYTYDDQGQLLTATHYANNTKTHTETYTYDNVGNILTFNNGTTSHTYTYGDTQWQDLVTKVDNQPITYDDSGNPTSYYNGYTMTWVEGRRLDSITTSNGTYTYVYNSDGQRVKKTNPDGSYIEYYVVNGVTVGESHFTAAGNKTLGIRYTLDENNTVIGFTTGGVNYYFAKNLQGDVLAVYQESNNAVVAQYTYDSWGNVVHATGSLAQINPFRYRGYYCDEETDFYYLQSRYYDPAIGRFLNPDQYSDTGDGVLGFNMFAYCLNNPVNRTDDGGCFSLSNLAKLAIGCVATVAAVGITLATGGAALPVLIGVATSTVSGAAVGAVKHRISTGSWEGAGKAAIDGAADGFMMGGLSALGGSVIGGVTRTIKNAKSGITIGKMGTFEDVAQLAKTRRYTGLKEYKFIKKIFGDKVATAVGWWQNKSVVKGVMALKGAIYDCGGELTGAYAKEVALTKGYEYLYNIWVM